MNDEQPDTNPEAMSRAELEREVHDLRDGLSELEAKFEAMSTRIGSVQELIIGDRNPVDDSIDERASVFSELDDIGSAVESHGDQLRAIENVETETTSRDEKILNIAAFAMRKAGGPNAKVFVSPDEVCGCTGVSRRYAYDLIDTIGDDEAIEWASVRQPSEVPAGNGSTHKSKGLKVEYEVLRESSHHDEVVNQFNTGSPEVSG